MADLNIRQERFLKSMLEAGSIEEACNNAGINRTTGYKYLRNKEFMDEYRSLRREIMQGVTAQLQKISSKAVDTLMQVMLDEEAPASSRVQSARAILDNAYKGIELDDILERVEQIEDFMEKK